MEYVFGTKGDIEILKVKSPSGTSLTGFQQTVLETDVDKTTHNYRIVEKYRTEVSEIDGSVYDFYEIDRHNTVIDKTPRVYQALADTNAVLDDVVIELLKKEG